MEVEPGRGERIRTSGFLLPKQALYQAELRPDAGEAMIGRYFWQPQRTR